LLPKPVWDLPPQTMDLFEAEKIKEQRLDFNKLLCKPATQHHPDTRIAITGVLF